MASDSLSECEHQNERIHMTQDTKTKRRTATVGDYIKTIIAIPFFWIILCVFYPPAGNFTKDFLKGFGLDLRARAVSNIEKYNFRTLNASGDDVVKIDISSFSQNWEKMTDVQRDAVMKSIDGKIVELTYQVYDVSRRFNFVDHGYGGFNISFGSNNILAQAYHLTCNFNVLTEIEDANLASMDSKTTLTFRGYLKKVGYTGIKMERCVVMQ
jgi:hypothetical protein